MEQESSSSIGPLELPGQYAVKTQFAAQTGQLEREESAN